MTNNELQRLGWDITRTFLKTVPKDYTGDILELSTKHLKDHKTLSELLKDNPESVKEVEIGMTTAVKDYLTLKNAKGLPKGKILI